MWRSTERASLEKKPSMRLSHDPCVGVNVKVKRPIGWAASQTRGLARDMSGMVVENDLDRGVGGVGGVEELEKLNEFTTAVAFLDQGMDVTGEQIDAGHQGQGAVAFVLMITHHGRAGAGKWRAIRRGRTDRLDPGFLVVRDDGEAAAIAAVLALLQLAHAASPLAGRHRGFRPSWARTRDRAVPGSSAPLCGLTSCSAKILHTVPWASFARLGCPAQGPCCRACAASSRVVHSSWG